MLSGDLFSFPSLPRSQQTVACQRGAGKQTRGGEVVSFLARPRHKGGEGAQTPYPSIWLQVSELGEPWLRLPSVAHHGPERAKRVEGPRYVVTRLVVLSTS